MFQYHFGFGFGFESTTVGKCKITWVKIVCAIHPPIGCHLPQPLMWWQTGICFTHLCALLKNVRNLCFNVSAFNFMRLTAVKYMPPRVTHIQMDWRGWRSERVRDRGNIPFSQELSVQQYFPCNFHLDRIAWSSESIFRLSFVACEFKKRARDKWASRMKGIKRLFYGIKHMNRIILYLWPYFTPAPLKFPICSVEKCELTFTHTQT